MIVSLPPVSSAKMQKLDREKTVINLYVAGHPIDEVWRASGFRSRSSVFRILNKHGIKLNRGNHSGPIKRKESKMEDIRKVFTIQWVGPFESFASLYKYLNDPNTCDCHLFSFYYCSGSKKGKGYPINKDDYRYFGLHRSETPIHMRVAPWHEHLRNFREPFSLWIGCFSDSIQQTPENIEDVETVFISTYKDVLTENTQKKKATPKESICIINLWYRSNEQRWLNKKRDIKVFDDVLVYEAESMTYSKGNLSIV